LGKGSEKTSWFIREKSRRTKRADRQKNVDDFLLLKGGLEILEGLGIEAILTMYSKREETILPVDKRTLTDNVI